MFFNLPVSMSLLIAGYLLFHLIVVSSYLRLPLVLVSTTGVRARSLC